MALKFVRILPVSNELGKPDLVPGLVGMAYVKKIPLADAKTIGAMEGLDGYSRILELTLCDADGNCLSPKEIDQIPFDATKALASIALDFNGLSVKSHQELEKNSDPGQTEG